MNNFNPKSAAWFAFGLYALLLFSLAWLSAPPPWDLLVLVQAAAKAVAPFLLLGGLFAKWGWKWKLLRGWLVPFPDLNGTWQGNIQTTWVDPVSGKTPGPIPVILTVTQSLFRISCVMRTEQMTSRSFFAGFWINPDEQVRMLGYSYNSDPVMIVRHQSAPHDGTAIFEVVESPTRELHGRYWTARKSTGDIRLTFRSSERLDAFPGDMGPHPVSIRPQT